jgi:hypothetical protein
MQMSKSKLLAAALIFGAMNSARAEPAKSNIEYVASYGMVRIDSRTLFDAKLLRKETNKWTTKIRVANGRPAGFLISNKILNEDEEINSEGEANSALPCGS